MTFFGRLRLLAGAGLVITVCTALFLFLEYSMSRIGSREAYLDSDSYTVGLDYSGVVEAQYKNKNDSVKAGDVLFEIRSATLSDAIRNNEVAAANLLYTVNGRGLVVITAAADGRVREIPHGLGAFVAAGEKLAIIDLAEGAYVRATYKLSAPDYTRLSDASRVIVTLPDGVSAEGIIYDISFTTADKQVMTTVRARIDTSTVNQRVFTSGTPVQTVLKIDDNSIAQQLWRHVKTYFNWK